MLSFPSVLPFPLRFLHGFPSKFDLRLFDIAVAMQTFGRRAAGVLQAAARKQCYSTANSRYAATAENLRINKDTKVIYQGFTGKQGRYVITVREFVEID